MTIRSTPSYSNTKVLFNTHSIKHRQFLAGPLVFSSYQQTSLLRPVVKRAQPPLTFLPIPPQIVILPHQLHLAQQIPAYPALLTTNIHIIPSITKLDIDGPCRSSAPSPRGSARPAKGIAQRRKHKKGQREDADGAGDDDEVGVAQEEAVDGLEEVRHEEVVERAEEAGREGEEGGGHGGGGGFCYVDCGEGALVVW